MAISITTLWTLYLIAAWTSLSCFCQGIKSSKQEVAPAMIGGGKDINHDRYVEYRSDSPPSIHAYDHNPRNSSKAHQKKSDRFLPIYPMSSNVRGRHRSRIRDLRRNKTMEHNKKIDIIFKHSVISRFPISMPTEALTKSKMRAISSHQLLPSSFPSFMEAKSKHRSFAPSPSSISSSVPSLSSTTRNKTSNLQLQLDGTNKKPITPLSPLQTHPHPPYSLSSASTSNTAETSYKSTVHNIFKRDAYLSHADFINPYFDSSLFTDYEDEAAANDSKRITLHIGGLFELTGNRHGGNGQSELLATQMAIAHVNQLEVIPGYRLELLYNDSQCDAGVGTDAFYDLVYRKSRHSSLLMVMGGACNEVTMTLAEIVNYWNIVMISYAADSPALSEREKYRTFFRMALGHSALDPPRRMLLEHFRWRKVAVLYEEVEALSLAFNTFRKDLASHGITVTSAESLKNAKVETPAKLRKLKDQDVRIIVAGFSEAVARMVLCEAYKMGLTGARYVWVLVGGLRRRWWQHEQNQDTSCTAEELSKAVDGMFTVFGLNGMLRGDSSIGNLTYSDFLSEYNSLNGSHPMTMFTVISYDTVWTMALAIRDTLQRWEMNGTALPLHQLNYSQMDGVKDGFIDSVESLSFSGVSGPVSFDGSDREGVSVVYQLQDGNYTPVALHKPLSSSLDFECDMCKPVFWAAGKVPKDAQRIVTRMKVILPSVFYPALALCMGGILMAVFFLCYNLYYRKLKFIKLSSPNLNNVAVLGCIMAYCDVILLGLDDTNLTNHAYSIVCTARAFLLSSGFSLAFGAMFAKTFRVHRIFTRANRGLLKSRLIRDSHLLVIIGVLLVLDMGLVCTWVVVDPMTRVVYNLTQQVSEDDPDLVYQEQLTNCYSNHLQEWLGAFYAYKGLLLVFGLYMAWETRHVKIPALNDSQYIGLNVYNVVIMAVCVVVISNIVSTRPNLAYGMVASFMILSTTVTLCLLFVPKMCAIVASKGNPIVASSGILVDRSNTRRFVFDDRKEVLYRAEVQNRVYKREIMELDQKICRLERLLDIPIHPIPRLTEELLYLLPQTLGERAPLGFKRGRRRALEWCNSISDGGEGVTWSATDSDDLNTDTSLLSPLSPGHHAIGQAITKSQENRNRKVAHSHGLALGKNLKSAKTTSTGKEKRIKTERCLSPCPFECEKCYQCNGESEFQPCSSPCCNSKPAKRSASKSYCKAVCRRNHKRKEKESTIFENKDLNYSMVHQTLKLLNLSVPAVPFPERIDQSRSLPEIFESKRKESVEETSNDNEIRTASSDNAVSNATPVSSRLNSPKKACDGLRIEVPCTHHKVEIGDIHVEGSGEKRGNSIICSGTNNDKSEEDYEAKYSSQMSPSQSWPSLDFRDDTILWDNSKDQSDKYKHKLLKQATVFSVSEFKIVSFDDDDDDTDDDDDDDNTINTSGDENGNDVFDSDEEDEEDNVCKDWGKCNHGSFPLSSLSLDRNDNQEYHYDTKAMNAHQNKSFDLHDLDRQNHQQLEFQYQKRPQDTSILHKCHVHFPNFRKRKTQFYLPLDQSPLNEHTIKSESCPRVNDPNHNFQEMIFEDETKHKQHLHFSADNLAQRNRHKWLKHLFRPKYRHHQPHNANNSPSTHNDNNQNNNNHFNNTPYQCLHLSNRLFDHHASDPIVPITADDDSFSERSRLLPLDDYEETSPSSLSNLTTWQSCSAIDPSCHYDSNRKSSLPANIISPSKTSPLLLPSPQTGDHANSITNAREITYKNYNKNARISQVISRPVLHDANANRSSSSPFSPPQNNSTSLLYSASSSSSKSSTHEQQNLPCETNAKPREQTLPTSMSKLPNPSFCHTSTTTSPATGGLLSSSSSSLSSSSPQHTQSPSTSSSSSSRPHTFPDSNLKPVAPVINNNPFSLNHQDIGTSKNAGMLWPLSERNKETCIGGINSGRNECLDEVSEF